MFSFLENLSRVSRGFHQFPRFDSYRRMFASNIERQRKYWQDHNFSVPSQHLIVRLLGSIPIRFTQSVNSYYDDMCLIASDVSGTLRITNEAYAGRATETPWLFGDGCVEVPFCTYGREPVDAAALARDWKRLAPLRFIRHPGTNLDLNSPMGKGVAKEPGLVVYEIDFPLLALQYREFLFEQSRKQSGSRETVAQFISKYVLANSIESMANVSFFNRLAAALNEEDLTRAEWRYVQALPNQLEWVDAYIQDVVKMLRGRSYTFAELLTGLKTATDGCLYDLCELDGLYPTRQLKWATFLAQLPYVAFLCRVAQESDRTPHTGALNEILRDLRYAKNDNLWASKVPSQIQLETTKELDELIAVCTELRN